MLLMFKTLLRRWPLVVVLLLVCGVLAFAASRVVSPTYQATGTVVLIPPSPATDPASNRYLLLGEITPARDILMRTLSSEETRHSIIGSVKKGEYVLEPDFTTSAPLVVVTATSADPRSTMAVLDRVLARLPETLKTLQDTLNVASASRLSVQPLTRDDKVTKVGKQQLRAVVATVGLVGVAGVLLIGVIDGLLLRRGTGRSGQRQTPTGPTTILPPATASVGAEPARAPAPPARPGVPQQRPPVRRPPPRVPTAATPEGAPTVRTPPPQPAEVPAERRNGRRV